MTRSCWLAVGCAAVALANDAFGLPGVLAAVAATIAVAIGASARPGPALPVVSAAWLVAGACLLGARLAIGIAATGAGTDAAPPAGSGPWIAEVSAISTPRQGQQAAVLRLEDPAGVIVTATLPRYPAIAPGDRVRVSGAIRGPRDEKDAAWLARSGALGSLLSRDLQLLPATGAGAGLEHLRRAAAASLARVLPEPGAGLAAGILIGLRDLVDRQVAAAFTAAGVSHVVAISGWNIAIVAGIVAAVLGRVRRRRRAAATLVAIVAYTVAAGASPSVVRAALMAAVVLMARETGRQARAVAALGIAAAAMLLADPGVVTDVGFELSTAATAGLLAWGSGITRWLGRTPGMPRWLAESLGVSLAAQASTLPIVLLAFGRLSVVAPLVNLAVVPLVPPVMGAGALALVAGAVAGFGAAAGPIASALGIVATAAALPAWALLSVMIAIVEAGAALPFASVTLDPQVAFLAALGMTVLLAVCGRRSSRFAAAAWFRRVLGGGARRVARTPARRPTERAPARRRRPFVLLGGALAVALAGLVVAGAARADGRTRVIVLDVGQGDAILVEGGRGGRLLVDGGPDPDVLLRELDNRLAPWDRRIDVVLLTHPHEDHVGGLPVLLERYRVGRCYEPGMRGAGPAYAAWTAQLAREAMTCGRLAAGDELRVDEVSLSVLWPDPGTVPLEPPDTGSGVNNVSIVLLGTVDGRRFLLTGDAEQDVDPHLLAQGLPAVDLLKVAHHGSRTATTAALLEALRPAVAVVSVGAGNTFGHPSPDTLGRIAASGARILRTDLVGDVEAVFATDGTFMVSGQRTAPATPGMSVADPDRAAAPLLYHRDDVDSRARRGRRAAPLARSPSLARPPFAGRGRGRGVARGEGRGPGARRGPRARRVGRAPPRRRQGAARRPPAPGVSPRRGLGPLARGPRLPRACSRRDRPPGLPARRGGMVAAVGGRGVARGAPRRLCRQARRPETRIDGRPLRIVAAAVPAITR